MSATGEDEEEREGLSRLVRQLREAIGSSLRAGRPRLAVALDSARDQLELLMAQEYPRRTRLAIARARAELALGLWDDRRAAPLARE